MIAIVTGALTGAICVTHLLVSTTRARDWKVT